MEGVLWICTASQIQYSNIGGGGSNEAFLIKASSPQPPQQSQSCHRSVTPFSAEHPFPDGLYMIIPPTPSMCANHDDLDDDRHGLSCAASNSATTKTTRNPWNRQIHHVAERASHAKPLYHAWHHVGAPGAQVQKKNCTC